MGGHDTMRITMKRLSTQVAMPMAAILAAALTLTPAAGAVDLVSVAINGQAASAASNGVATNFDGTVVAFYSDASNLVPGDTNGFRDIFVRDLIAGTTERINLGPGLVQANAPSHAAGGPPAISADGTVIAFYSLASNLVEGGDTNGFSDVFLYDRTTERLTMISLAADGSQANGASLAPSISANGRYVAYQSLASNLVDGDTNDVSDIFVYDVATGTTERICDDNVQPNRPSSSPSISPDGFFVAFATSASNLIEGDTNGLVDVYVCNRRNSQFDRVSIGFRGQGNGISIVPDISASGCFVAFKSEADNLVPDDRNQRVDVFVRNRGLGETELISKAIEGGSANDASFPPSITDEGRFVAFGSAATNLLVGDLNNVASVYVRDRLTGGIRLVDVNDAGRQADAGTPDVPPSISGDASEIGFVSAASNLTPSGVDRNFTNDVFIAENVFDPTMIGNVCCNCDDNTCTEPSGGICPDSCVPVCEAICEPGPGIPGGNCVSIIPPTETPTATAGSPTTTQTATATGGTETPTPTATGGTATATATATQTENGATATATQTGGTATPTNTGGTATPTHTGGTATPTHTGGTATPTHTGGTATPTNTGGTATPTHTGGTATPTHTGGTATPTRTGTRGTATPNATLTPRFDDDGCAIVPPAQGGGSSNGALLLLLPAALMVGRRRRS